MSLITLSDGTATLELDKDLFWEDEYEWAPVEQAMERGLTGAPILHLGLRQYGRPITLRPDEDNAAWMPRSVARKLQTWAAIPGQRLTLNLRGDVHTVIFRHHDDGPYGAQPVMFDSDPDDSDWLFITIRLMTMPPE